MFGKPKCPVEDWVEEWLRGRLGWLVDKFGAERLFTGTVILPTEKFFPYPLNTDENVERTFALICGYLDVEPSTLSLELVDGDSTRDWFKGQAHEWSSDEPGGTWDNQVGHRIRISRDTLGDPMHFVAVAAHELCHERLIGGGLMTGDEDDHEPLTDLATVYFGLGLFGANSCIHFRQTQGLATEGHEWGRSGYLELAHWAYALALFAHARAENRPEWLSHLRADARAVFKKGIKYLAHSGQGIEL